MAADTQQPIPLVPFVGLLRTMRNLLLQAAEALAPESKLAGQAYFITNAEPQNMWGFLGDLLAGLGYPRPRLRMPTWLAYLIACIIEFIVAPLLKVQAVACV